MLLDKDRLETLIKHTSSLKLLYVEDDREIRNSTLKVFNRFFKEITIATNGQDAFEIFKSQKIDIVITDIDMPLMDGLSASRLIREKDKDVPILLLSAYSESKYFIDAIKIGVDSYLIKPVDMAQFIEALFKVTDRIILKKELEDYKYHLEEKVQQQTQKIKESYYKDSLTSLPNLAKLQEVFESKTKIPQHLILLDTVNFSAINKEYGKMFANSVLVSISKELLKFLNSDMNLYRGDSDCFIICCDITDKDEIVEYAKSILTHFDNSYIDVLFTQIKMNFSVGIAKSESCFFDTMVHLDYALDFSKKIGRRHYHYYEEDSQLFREETEMIKWLGRTKDIIHNNDIIPYFQPIAELKTDKIVKYEILTRVVYDAQLYPPNFFMAAVMRQGIVSSVTKIIIDKSFLFFKDNDYTFSLNITLRDLEEDYLYEYVKIKLQEYEIDPSRLSFEILEDISIDPNHIHLIEQINSFRSLGCKISIDDFGIENSNFSRLFAFDVDYIKLDGIFIRDILKHEKNKLITKAIVNLAKLLKIKVIAEYVESKEIYEYLKENGLDYAQGYYIGQPQSYLL